MSSRSNEKLVLKSSRELRFIFLALPEGAAPAPQRRSRCLCSEPWGRPGGPTAGCPSLAGKVSPGFVVIALGFAGRRGWCRAVLCHEISSPALSEGLLAGVWRGYVLGAGFLLGFYFYFFQCIRRGISPWVALCSLPQKTSGARKSGLDSWKKQFAQGSCCSCVGWARSQPCPCGHRPLLATPALGDAGDEGFLLLFALPNAFLVSP